MKVVTQLYLFFLFLIYCLYSLVVFSRMPKDFLNTYNQIYRKSVKFLPITVILFIFSLLLWYVGEWSISATVLHVIIRTIAIVIFALYFLEGGYLTWSLPFLFFLKKHNYNRVVVFIEKRWEIFNSQSEQRKCALKIFVITWLILWQIIPLIVALITGWHTLQKYK